MNHFGQDRRVTVYSIAVLEDAPWLVRAMIVHGMKSGVPLQQHDHFLLVYQGESELKRIIGFERSEEGYLLLVDSKGKIQCGRTGPLARPHFTN